MQKYLHLFCGSFLYSLLTEGSQENVSFKETESEEKMKQTWCWWKSRVNPRDVSHNIWSVTFLFARKLTAAGQGWNHDAKLDWSLVWSTTAVVMNYFCQ